MTRRILTLALAAALTAAACGGTDTAVEPRLETVGFDQFSGLIDDAPEGLVVLDVRTPGEFAEAHIPGAVMIDFYSSTFRSDLGTLDKDAPIALYCRSGNRSGQTLDIMRELGFTDVRNLDGGIITWVENDGALQG